MEVIDIFKNNTMEVWVDTIFEEYAKARDSIMENTTEKLEDSIIDSLVYEIDNLPFLPRGFNLTVSKHIARIKENKFDLYPEIVGEHITLKMAQKALEFLIYFQGETSLIPEVFNDYSKDIIEEDTDVRIILLKDCDIDGYILSAGDQQLFAMGFKFR